MSISRLMSEMPNQPFTATSLDEAITAIRQRIEWIDYRIRDGREQIVELEKILAAAHKEDELLTQLAEVQKATPQAFESFDSTPAQDLGSETGAPAEAEVEVPAHDAAAVERVSAPEAAGTPTPQQPPPGAQLPVASSDVVPSGVGMPPPPAMPGGQPRPGAVPARKPRRLFHRKAS